MKGEGDRISMFSRRAFLLAGGQGALTTILLGRMYYLGVVEADKYETLANENRISRRLLAPDRGVILDRAGKILAGNRKDYRIFLIPEETRDVHQTLLDLGQVIELSEAKISRLEKRIKQQRKFLPVTVAENVSWEEFAQINVKSVNLPGVQPDAGASRYYPAGKKVGHVLGYVGPPSEMNVFDDQDPLLQLPGFKIGKIGLERFLEKQLRGEAGDKDVEVNAYGRVVRQLAEKEPKQGEEAVLTLDLGLQEYAFDLMGEESAAAVVIDIHTGDILSLVSTPSFDSNDFNFGISHENWNALQADPRKPLLNKATQGQYPPGSTVKMAVALAALKEGKVTKDEKVWCNGKHTLGGHTFHCWKKQGHGWVNMEQAIASSCDVYFYDVAVRTGIDNLAEMFKKFGFGQAFDLGLTGEQKGLVPTRQWKQAMYNKPWLPGDTVIVGIGQGALLTTPLQLAVMSARIANGGWAVMPRIVHSIGGVMQPRVDPERIDVDPEHILWMQQAMQSVMKVGGTAWRSRLRGEGMSMAGKTGTSQVRRITMAEREAGDEAYKERAWKERDHAIFMGFGPVEQPRYAVAVVVEHGGGGSSVAAPLANKIMRRTLERDPSRTFALSAEVKLGSEGEDDA